MRSCLMGWSQSQIDVQCCNVTDQVKRFYSVSLNDIGDPKVSDWLSFNLGGNFPCAFFFNDALDIPQHCAQVFTDSTYERNLCLI